MEDNKVQAVTDPVQEPPAQQAPAETKPAQDAATETKPAQDAAYWKAESRKWEARAKENREKAEKWDEAEAAGKGELERAQADAEAARAEAEAANAELSRMRAASAVSAETGVPAALLHGSTEEEMRSEASAIMAYARTAPAYPADKGGASGGGPTKSSIESIKDPAARLRARAENINLYR